MPTDWNGSISVTRAKRKFTLPRSLANVKRQGWAKKRLKNRKYLAWTTRRQDASCWCQYKIQTREHLLRTTRNGKANKRPSGRPSWKRLESSLPNPGQGLHEDRGAVRRRAVQPGASRFPRYNRCRKDDRPPGGRTLNCNSKLQNVVNRSAILDARLTTVFNIHAVCLAELKSVRFCYCMFL